MTITSNSLLPYILKDKIRIQYIKPVAVKICLSVILSILFFTHGFAGDRPFNNAANYGGIGLMEKLFNSKMVPARGDPFTVDAAWFSFNAPFAMSGGSSQRYIADLSDLSNSVIIHTTGQSGHLFHRHREDFIAMWEAVEYHPMIWSREAAEANAEAALRLTPP